MPSAAIHSSPYSGSWYPSSPSELRQLLGELFETSSRRTGAFLLPQAVAFVVPHAGLVYSGRVAAAVYRHIQRDGPNRIALLGFAHRGAPPGVWIPEVEAIRTPLGETFIDRQAVEELLACPEFGRMPEARLCDHSVEIQLPLLAAAAPAARIVPVYVSSLRASARHRAAAALARLVGPGSVLVASSDFTHYGEAFHYTPFPHDEFTQARIRELDQEAIDAAASLQADLFLQSLKESEATVCGREPVSLLLAALRSLSNNEDIFQKTLDYETSGDITGDYSHCVSYSALGYFPWEAFLLDEQDQALLLNSARRTLRHYQETGKPEPLPPERVTPSLERRCGAFVTLHQNHRLRGCVGRCSARDSLARIVPELTLAAALEDARFQPVGREERDIAVEISVLSPMKRLPDPAQFRVGRDGGYLEGAGHSGVLLPHVASGRDWTSEEFLTALARKAGTGPHIYSAPGTRLFVFRAQVFG